MNFHWNIIAFFPNVKWKQKCIIHIMGIGTLQIPLPTISWNHRLLGGPLPFQAWPHPLYALAGCVLPSVLLLVVTLLVPLPLFSSDFLFKVIKKPFKAKNHSNALLLGTWSFFFVELSHSFVGPSDQSMTLKSPSLSRFALCSGGFILVFAVCPFTMTVVRRSSISTVPLVLGGAGVLGLVLPFKQNIKHSRRTPQKASSECCGDAWGGSWAMAIYLYGDLPFKMWLGAPIFGLIPIRGRLSWHVLLEFLSASNKGWWTSPFPSIIRSINSLGS